MSSAGGGIVLGLAVLLAPLSSRAQEAPQPRPLPMMVVSGTVTRSGQVELGPFMVVDGSGAAARATPGARPDPAYRFELLDRRGMVVSEASFDLSFEQEIHSAQGSEVRSIEVTPFLVTLSLPDSAVVARLRHGESILATRFRSAHAPAVLIEQAILEPGKVAVRWRCSDADGGAVTYAVFYAPDGKSFESVAVDLDATELSFDLDAHAPWPTAAAAVRVRASDGWNFGEATAPLTSRR